MPSGQSTLAVLKVVLQKAGTQYGEQLLGKIAYQNQNKHALTTLFSACCLMRLGHLALSQETIGNSVTQVQLQQ